MPPLGRGATRATEPGILCAPQTHSGHFTGIPVEISPLPGSVSLNATLLGLPQQHQPCLGCFLFLFLRDMIRFLAFEGDAFYFFPGVSPEKQALAPNTQSVSAPLQCALQQGSPLPSLQCSDCILGVARRKSPDFGSDWRLSVPRVSLMACSTGS